MLKRVSKASITDASVSSADVSPSVVTAPVGDEVAGAAGL
jgi:hypothetical protein